MALQCDQTVEGLVDAVFYDPATNKHVSTVSIQL